MGRVLATERGLRGVRYSLLEGTQKSEAESEEKHLRAIHR